MRFNFKKLIIIFLILAGGLFLFNLKFNFFKFNNREVTTVQKPGLSGSVSWSPSVLPRPSSPISPMPTPRSVAPPAPSILLEVPFFAQAPFGEWADPIFQNACEEAAVVMAMHWVNGTLLTKEQAKSEILAVSEFEDKTYGPAIDRSVTDTLHLFKDYFNYQNVRARSNISTEDIKQEILKGNLLVVPINGQILKNPFYTPPGPAHHMIVVIGYDGNSDEFITNDIGTRHGQKYRYKASRLEASLQDYPTGSHLPSTPGATAMIVVEPK